VKTKVLPDPIKEALDDRRQDNSRAGMVCYDDFRKIGAVAMEEEPCLIISVAGKLSGLSS